MTAVSDRIIFFIRLFFKVYESCSKIRRWLGFQNDLSVNGGITLASCRFKGEEGNRSAKISGKTIKTESATPKSHNELFVTFICTGQKK